MPARRALALTGGSIGWFWFVLASLRSAAFPFVFYRDCFLLLGDRLVFTSFGTARFLLRRFLRFWDQSELLEDFLMGRIQTDQLPCFSVCTDFLGTIQNGHDLLIGLLFQQLCLVKCLDQPESQKCGQEVAEFAPYNRVIILYAGLIEFTGRFRTNKLNEEVTLVRQSRVW